MWQLIQIHQLHAKKSDMQHWTSSDSSYLSASKARIRVGGHHFLGNIPEFDQPLDH